MRFKSLDETRNSRTTEDACGGKHRSSSQPFSQGKKQKYWMTCFLSREWNKDLNFRSHVSHQLLAHPPILHRRDLVPWMLDQGCWQVGCSRRAFTWTQGLCCFKVKCCSRLVRRQIQTHGLTSTNTSIFDVWVWGWLEEYCLLHFVILCWYFMGLLIKTLSELHKSFPQWALRLCHGGCWKRRHFRVTPQDKGPPGLGCGGECGCSMVAPAVGEKFMLLGLFWAELCPSEIHLLTL